jgi:hypothetical protein
MPAEKDAAYSIEWNQLIDEFNAFEADEDFKKRDAKVFADALVQPVPDFVDLLLTKRNVDTIDTNVAVRDLYAFLLQKRYDERLNLLYFAFDLFCDDSPLPEAVINETPFPHEDGSPPYRSRLDSSFKLL